MTIPILSIRKPSGISHIIWEHALKSFFAFSGTFACTYFIPLFLGASRGSRHTDQNMGMGLFEYFLYHPEIQVLVSVLAVVIYNLITLRKNRKKEVVLGVQVSHQNMEFEISNYYCKSFEFVPVPLDKISYAIEKKQSSIGTKSQRITFYNIENQAAIGIVDLKHTIWQDQILKVKKMVLKLEELKIPRNVKNQVHPSMVRSFFK